MIAFRNGKVVILCDGCYNIIVDKEPRKGNHRMHFHNRRCEEKHKHRGDLNRKTVPAEEIDRRQGYRPVR